MSRLKINLWAWRHLIIGITKAHLEEIAPFFSRDEKGCKQLLETNIYFNIFPWQAAHQSQMNLGVYGLDVAFPARLQPAVMGAYRQISRIWHYWLEVLDAEEVREWRTRGKWSRKRVGNIESGGEDESGEEDESTERAGKRRKIMDPGRPTTPKDRLRSLNLNVEESPTTKALKVKARDIIDAIESRRRGSDLLKEFETLT